MQGFFLNWFVRKFYSFFLITISIELSQYFFSSIILSLWERNVYIVLLFYSTRKRVYRTTINTVLVLVRKNFEVLNLVGQEENSLVVINRL